MDLVIIGKGDDGTVMAQELADLDDMGEFERLETELAETLAEEDVLKFGATMGPCSPSWAPCSSTRTYGPQGFASAVRHAGGRWLPRPGFRSRPSSPPSRRTKRRLSPKESEMPLRSSRLGRAAVVTAAVTPGPSPIAKAAVVGAAVSKPGPAPIAKTAVVAAAITPGRRRF